MIHIEITRKVDKEGRIVIPKEYRYIYNIKENEPVYIIGTENGILLSNEQNFKEVENKDV